MPTMTIEHEDKYAHVEPKEVEVSQIMLDFANAVVKTGTEYQVRWHEGWTADYDGRPQWRYILLQPDGSLLTLMMYEKNVLTEQ